MKKYRKSLALLLGLAMTASLAACAGTAGSTANSGQSDGQGSGQNSESTAAGSSTEQTGSADGILNQTDRFIDRASKTSQTSKGIKVKVDYSAYQASKTKEANYTRISDQTITKLQASVDYGTIYPFAGEVLYLSYEDGYSSVGGYKYGIADEKGEIVCDPVYQDFYVPYYTDTETGEYTYLPFYVLEQFDVAYFGEEEFDYSYNVKCTIASFDGAFVSDAIYRSVQAFPGGLILQKTGDEDQNFTIISLNGKTLMTDADLQLPKGVSADYTEWSGYGDLFLTYCNDYEEVYFFDLTGKAVLGPYQSSSGFNQGLASVITSEGYGVIDTQGNYIVQPDDYDGITISNGYIIATRDDENQNLFFDSAGKEITSINIAGWADATADLFIVYDQNDYEKVYVYDHTGKQLLIYNLETQGLASHSPVLYTQEDGKITLTNLMTGAEAEIEGEEGYVENIHLTTGASEDFQTDSKLLEVMYLRPDSDPEEYDWIYSYYDPDTLEPVIATGRYTELKYDAGSNEKMILEEDGGTYHLYDDSYRILRTYRNLPDFYNGAAVVTDDSGCTIYDASGAEIFYYPLVQSYDD